MVDHLDHAENLLIEAHKHDTIHYATLAIAEVLTGILETLTKLTMDGGTTWDVRVRSNQP